MTEAQSKKRTASPIKVVRKEDGSVEIAHNGESLGTLRVSDAEIQAAVGFGVAARVGALIRASKKGPMAAFDDVAAMIDKGKLFELQRHASGATGAELPRPVVVLMRAYAAEGNPITAEEATSRIKAKYGAKPSWRTVFGDMYNTARFGEVARQVELEAIQAKAAKTAAKAPEQPELDL